MTEQQFFIGDKVYPKHYHDIEDYAFDVAELVCIPAENLYGIVTAVEDECSYGVVWIDAETRKEISVPLRNAWWDERELTDDREEFLDVFNEALADTRQIIQDCDNM